MGRTSLRPWFMGNKMQFEAVACRLFLHYSYTLAQKASNYGIFASMIINDEEKRNVVTALIKEIEIYRNDESEYPLKRIGLNFPVFKDGGEVTELLWDKGNTVETVCLLSKLNAKQHIEVDIHMDELDLTDAEKKATYSEIKEYVLEHTGLKVSSLYIAQVKQKCGIIERENYNKPKSDDAKQPQCPPDKEKAIKEALKHFGMI